MLDRSLETEFASYRKTLSTDEARRAFDERIERLLSQHGVDYVRGYVDALKDTSSAGYWKTKLARKTRWRQNALRVLQMRGDIQPGAQLNTP